MTLSLDGELDEEIRQLGERYKYFGDTLNIKPEGLKQLDYWNKEHIRKMCMDEDLNPDPYLAHYQECKK